MGTPFRTKYPDRRTMSKQVTGAFEIDMKGDDVVHWDTAQMQRNSGTKVFQGDVTGTSTLEAVMLGREGGPMVYVAVEKLDLEFEGLKGSFFLAHQMSANGKDYAKSLTIVPGSGTGDLEGISGTAEITRDHRLILDYDLG